ncbi:hypothetical protein CE195_02130 [Sodalis-like symbiont of Philaenus spumarius]|nr:hypothetical protein CE195_02130 [Sodalis-like symbiont of Philaenus spumarius]
MSYFMVVSVSGKPLFDVKPIIKMLLIYLAIFHSNSMFDSFTYNIICRSSIVHVIWELGGRTSTGGLGQRRGSPSNGEMTDDGTYGMLMPVDGRRGTSFSRAS